MTTPVVSPPSAGDYAADRRKQLSEHVVKQVTSLQERYHANSASAVASLARLRRAVNRPPGSDPAVWQETFHDFPPSLLGRDDEPSLYERATHAAITLYAVHQQSQSKSMHQAGFGIGGAARRLGEQTSNEEAVLKRFQSLGTANSFNETVYHARSLITQLRPQGLAIDYGQFAIDLIDIQDPKRSDSVRLRWGRDYYRVTAPQQTPSTDNDTAETPAAEL